MQVSLIKPNPNNPRHIKKDKFDKLVNSIKQFPEMLEARPLILNKDNVVLGGNMRLQALIKAGINDVPVIHVDWDADKQSEFIIKDNLSYGEWDYDIIANEWDVIKLDDWGFDLNIGSGDEKKIDGEIKFSNELDYESNYIVLKFNKDIDFLQIESMLGIESTYSKRQNGKPWNKGRGRVVDGVDAIIKIKEI